MPFVDVSVGKARFAMRRELLPQGSFYLSSKPVASTGDLLSVISFLEITLYFYYCNDIFQRSGMEKKLEIKIKTSHNTAH